MFIVIVLAFIALGNAYAVLSNKDKRAQYDLYGTEGPRRRTNQYEDEFSEYDYGRGFEGLSPNCCVLNKVLKKIVLRESFVRLIQFHHL